MTGTIILAAGHGVTAALLGVYAVYLALVLCLLRALSVDRGARRDDALISAIAIIGRATVVALVAHLSMTAAHWSPPAYRAVMATLGAIMVGQAATMARRGPTTTLTLPTPFADSPAAVPAAGGPVRQGHHS